MGESPVIQKLEQSGPKYQLPALIDRANQDLCHYYLVAVGQIPLFPGEEKVLEQENCADCDDYSCSRVCIPEKEYRENIKNAPFLDQVVQIEEQLAAFNVKKIPNP